MIDFWSFWGCLGSIFGRLGASCGVFWRPWRVLGGSWEALAGSGGRLGSILGGLESPWVVKGRFRASKALRSPTFRGAKGGRDEVKLGPETDKNRSQK